MFWRRCCIHQALKRNFFFRVFPYSYRTFLEEEVDIFFSFFLRKSFFIVIVPCLELHHQRMQFFFFWNFFHELLFCHLRYRVQQRRRLQRLETVLSSFLSFNSFGVFLCEHVAESWCGGRETRVDRLRGCRRRYSASSSSSQSYHTWRCRNLRWCTRNRRPSRCRFSWSLWSCSFWRSGFPDRRHSAAPTLRETGLSIPEHHAGWSGHSSSNNRGPGPGRGLVDMDSGMPTTDTLGTTRAGPATSGGLSWTIVVTGFSSCSALHCLPWWAQVESTLAVCRNWKLHKY